MARVSDGGLLTLYERLGSLLSDRGLSAFYADPRLEAFVPADGEVVVLGALRRPIRIDRAAWDARVAAADDGSELAEGFIRSALGGASEVIEQARHAAQEEPGTLGAPRPEAIEQRAPGEVELDLLGDSDCELTERFDPEGNPEESWVSCRVLRGRGLWFWPSRAKLFGSATPADPFFRREGIGCGFQNLALARLVGLGANNVPAVHSASIARPDPLAAAAN